MRDSKIFITGHRGLLGTAVERKLREAGYTNILTRSRDELNLTDTEAVSEFMDLNKPDCIVMCAAKVGGIQANVKDPVNFLVQNMTINNNVICSALNTGVGNILYIGSSCMYPRDYLNPLKEEYLLAAPLEPTNEGYALAKITGAKLCEYCNAEFGTSYKILIPCNLYGPGDKFASSHSHLVAAIIDKIHQAKMEGLGDVVIWGDGSVRREFLFVDDLAEYICSCMDRIDSLPDYLNVGYGKDHTVLEYYEKAAEVLDYDGGFVFDTTKPVGMSTKLLDSSKATEYGWNPRTSLSEGIAKTYEYYLNRTKESDR